MSDSSTDRRERVGAAFSLAAMIEARDRTFEAVQGIARAVRPGMTQRQAGDAAQALLERMGMDRLWHRTLVRFGEETLKTFHGAIDPDLVLRERDIFFIDIGVVWNGHEGDAGDTFVIGDDPDHLACAQAARDLWNDVSVRWREDKLSGEALYAHAARRAEAMGWRLNLEIKGHRVCDFPHAIYRAGSLGDFGLCPSSGLWILEIQIAHPTKPFGAFYEDILIG
jgi:Xaa-Pro aminopeptidase